MIKNITQNLGEAMNTKTLTVFIATVAALAAVLAYSACTRVTLAGDQDHPISINADIKIHIYQHAASNVDKIMEGLDKAEEPEDADDDGASASFLARAVEAVSMSSAYAAEPATDPLTKVKEIYHKAFPLLKKGMLGENRDGYVSVVNKAASTEPGDAAAAAKAADELNAARKAMYENDVKTQGGNIRSIQESYARVWSEKSPKGVWVEVQENKAWVWKQK